MLLEVPSFLRISIVLAFAFLTPGVALTRTFSPTSFFERLLVTSSISVSAVVLVSTALLAVGLWSPSAILLILGVVSIVGHKVVSNSPASGKNWLDWERRSSDESSFVHSRRAKIMHLGSDGCVISGPGLAALDPCETVRLTWLGEVSFGRLEEVEGDVFALTFLEPTAGFEALVAQKYGDISAAS